MKYTFSEYKKSTIKSAHLNLGQTRSDGASYDVNSLYITKDGKPWIGVMGEYHFVRDSRDNWKKELAKMKAGGITVVATYVFWIYHEEIEGRYDFSVDRDLRRFICLCQEMGLSVFLRIGPWAHGEVRNGGFPDWLINKGIGLRENNPEYLALAKTWYAKIYEQVQGLFFKDYGPIIGVQIENELTDNLKHLGKLKEIALEIGFDAPLWTVTGWNSLYGAKFPLKEFLPVFGAYVDAPWLEHNRLLPPSKHFTFDTARNDAAIGMDLINECDDEGWRLPYEDYPFATGELGSGLPSTYIRRPYVSPADAYALSLVKLGCGNNLVGYYMYHGGTNKIGRLSTLQESKATGYPNDYAILNYDFQTCVGQYGQIREQYRLCNLLHLFINDFGEILAPMEHVAADKFVDADDKDSLRYCMRTDGDSGFVFINHHQRGLELDDVDEVEIDTGTVAFPSINIAGDIACIFPFNLKVGSTVIEYATAQLLCKSGNTLFFAKVPNVDAIYSINGKAIKIDAENDMAVNEAGNITIVTIPFNDALYLRKIDDEIYLGKECDIYKMDDKILSAEVGAFTYGKWDDERHEFDWITVTKSEKNASVSFEDCVMPFAPTYMDELMLSKYKELFWRKISVDSLHGIVEIPFKYDVAQIYADGQLVADSFYLGTPWQVAANLIYGKESYITYTRFNEDVYIDA